MDMVVLVVVKVVVRLSEVRDVLYCGCSGGTSLQVLDIGYVPTYW